MYQTQIKDDVLSQTKHKTLTRCKCKIEVQNTRLDEFKIY